VHGVTELVDDGEVVGDQQVAQSVFVAQLRQQVQDAGLHGDVEGAGRFVQDEQPRIDGEPDVCVQRAGVPVPRAKEPPLILRGHPVPLGLSPLELTALGESAVYGSESVGIDESGIDQRRSGGEHPIDQRQLRYHVLDLPF
jgi:hypothetical protein